VTGRPPSAFATRVLDLVDHVPRRRAVTYGDLADAVGCRSSRAVGQVLRAHGHEVPWHRVVMADGSPAPGKPAEQLARLRRDRTPLTGDRVDLRRARHVFD
jgi:methylated-DNA-protein-cysteine methyltransferase-like protein